MKFFKGLFIEEKIVTINVTQTDGFEVGDRVRLSKSRKKGIIVKVTRGEVA